MLVNNKKKINKNFEINKYTLEMQNLPKNLDGYKILHLSDLHSKLFDKDNRYLVNEIKKLSPDMIIMTGDMLNGKKKDDGKVCIHMVRQLISYYPIYYVLGNHELLNELFTRNLYVEYINNLISMGVKILDNSKATMELEGQRITIYGLTIDLSYYWIKLQKNKLANILPVNYLKHKIGSLNEEEVNILAVHTPKYFKQYIDWGADLVLSGHIHGGIVRLPYLGGVLSPDRNFFPKYDSGLYEEKGGRMIVSRGLGNSSLKIRIFNKPELILTTLKVPK